MKHLGATLLMIIITAVVSNLGVIPTGAMVTLWLTLPISGAGANAPSAQLRHFLTAHYIDRHG